MSRSAEQRFREHFPNATIERQKANDGEVYFIVRKERGALHPFAYGETKVKAWAGALSQLDLIRTGAK